MNCFAPQSNRWSEPKIGLNLRARSRFLVNAQNDEVISSSPMEDAFAECFQREDRDERRRGFNLLSCWWGSDQFVLVSQRILASIIRKNIVRPT
jgi:hypothetical protein